MSEEEPPRERPGTFAALRVRDFALLWSGQSVSSLGDGIFSVALVIEALAVDPRPTGLALVIAGRAVPAVLFAVLGGVVVDRVPKRLAMLSSDLARGLAVTALAVLVASHRAHLAELVGLTVIFGVGDAFFGPASLSIVPEIVPHELLVSANALNSTSDNLARSLIGPALGGAIVGLIGVTGSFVADGISFGVSILSLVMMSAHVKRTVSGGSMWAEARAGFSYIRAQQWLWITLVAAGIANFFGIAPLTVLLALLVRHVLHGSPLALGLVFAAGGAAGVAASLLVARMGRPHHLVVTMWSVYAVAGGAIAAMAAAPDPLIVGLLSAVEIGCITYGDVLYFTMMQQRVPADLRGRVFSVSGLIVGVLMPIGTVVGGMAAAGLGTRTALVLSGVLSGACSLVMFIPGAREPAGLSAHAATVSADALGDTAAEG